MLRTAGRKGPNMAETAYAENTEEEIEIVERPSNTALKRIASDINLDRVLKWEDADSMSEWYALVQKPPLRSVVAHIGPEMAA